MSAQHALYVLAHQHGLPLERFGVDPDTLIKVGGLAREVTAGTQPAPPTRPSRARKPVPARTVTVKAPGLDPTDIPQFVSKHAKPAVGNAAEAYTLLYLFENAIRDVVIRVLQAQHGVDWWTRAVPPDIQKQAAKRMKQDSDDPWHTPRGNLPIHYLDLHHYRDIILAPANWPLFEPLLDRPTLVEETLRDINLARRVVAHMNPLTSADLTHVRANFRKLMGTLKAREGALPSRP
jgi:hypothetical protein